MKIIATGKDGVRPYRMMDDCPRCGDPVDGFQCDYGMAEPNYSWGDPVRFGPTLTLQPCRCTVSMESAPWNVYQFSSKADWNKEVVTHELRNRSKESRKGSASDR